jgi:hypothetical protein
VSDFCCGRPMLDRINNRSGAAELTMCSPSELRRIAQEVGLNETEFSVFASRHRGPTGLMPRRLQQLRLDPAYVKAALAATYRDLEKVCGTCKAWRRCARDLEKGDVQAGMDSYCLNAFTIDMLTVDRPIPGRVAKRSREDYYFHYQRGETWTA